MHLPTIATALLLPLLAAAEGLTTTQITSTITQTQTITLRRNHVVTSTYGSNSTATYLPTGTGVSTTSFTTGKATGSASPSASPISKNAGSALGAAHVVFAGVAGMAVVALL
ncbi:hypothetical protein GE09DRAFT_1056523 [Coniochaeta sp. 2T2.1]|nr:hypothetical protein GE09DRAFT_1056523 [Coniochaeta sp. 2T2.1]